jgi:hypothetical protein
MRQLSFVMPALVARIEPGRDKRGFNVTGICSKNEPG